MAAGGIDPVSAVANAVGSGFETMTAWVQKATERYRFQKGMEVQTVAFEQQKTLDLFGAVGDQRKMMNYAAILLIVAVVLIKLFRR